MRTRTKTCPTCGGNFSYEIGQGKDRRHCSDVCRVKHQVKRKGERYHEDQAKLARCSTPDCPRKATRKAVGLCEACYHQVRRTGGVARIPRKYKTVTGAGYVRLRSFDHPLSTKDGWVFEHRAVAYTVHGQGPISCFWCSVGLVWADAVVDHLNENKQDNRPENLAVSCNNCNRARGSIVPFIRRMRPDALDVFVRVAKELNDTTAPKAGAA